MKAALLAALLFAASCNAAEDRYISHAAKQLAHVKQVSWLACFPGGVPDPDQLLGIPQRMIKMQVDAARGRGAISARISQIMKEWGEKKRQALLRMKSDAKLSGGWRECHSHSQYQLISLPRIGVKITSLDPADYGLGEGSDPTKAPGTPQ